MSQGLGHETVILSHCISLNALGDGIVQIIPGIAATDRWVFFNGPGEMSCGRDNQFLQNKYFTASRLTSSN